METKRCEQNIKNEKHKEDSVQILHFEVDSHEIKVVCDTRLVLFDSVIVF